jgi:cation transport regulator ChaB
VGMPAKDEMPDTIRRSPAKARRTWSKAHDSAVETYGEGEAAHRTAYSALKHSFEKKGDRWTAKDEKGPSDPRAKKSGRAAIEERGETFGGVDYEGSTKQELYERARDLGIEGRSSMDKKELARAIARKQ